MKVVHVITGTNVGGAQIMLQRYLAALGSDARDHSVVSLMGDGVIAEPIRSLGVNVTSLNLREGQVTPGSLVNLRRAVRELAPDVVHGWMYHGCMAAWAAIAGRITSKPGLVWAVHHSLQDIQNEKRSNRILIRALAKLSGFAGQITYCSDVSRKQHEAIGFSGANSALIPNAIDTNMFRPDDAARKRLEDLCGVNDGRFFVGNFARSHPMKDHVSMVRATAKLLESGYDVHAVIFGQGTTTSPAVAEANALGISDRFSAFEGRPDVEKLVPGLDIFLLSSAWGEAFPLAVAEAMACQVPCVVTDVGDSGFLVGNSGLVVPPADPDAQAGAVAQLLDAGPDKRAELGQLARERIKSEFSAERYIQLHEDAYLKAMYVKASSNSGLSKSA